ADALQVADVAEGFFRESASWDVRIRERAAADLVGLANEWREPSEPELTTHEFMRRLGLESVTFGWEGDFELWFDDGDLFQGHSIAVEGTLADGATCAAILG